MFQNEMKVKTKDESLWLIGVRDDLPFIPFPFLIYHFSHLSKLLNSLHQWYTMLTSCYAIIYESIRMFNSTPYIKQLKCA